MPCLSPLPVVERSKSYVFFLEPFFCVGRNPTTILKYHH